MTNKINEWVKIPSIRALLNARRDKINEEVNPIEATTVESVKSFELRDCPIMKRTPRVVIIKDSGV